MAQISAQAEQEIRKLLENWWTSVNQQLAAATGSEVQIGAAPVERLYSSEIGQRLVQIALASQGATRWSKTAALAVVQACDAFEAWLNQSPITHKTPEEFWNTPVGYMVLRARLWADKDKLISVTEAADISGLSISTLSQRISRGTLMGYNDPFEPNPRRSRRIRLSTIQQLLGQSEYALKYHAKSTPRAGQAGKSTANSPLAKTP